MEELRVRIGPPQTNTNAQLLGPSAKGRASWWRLFVKGNGSTPSHPLNSTIAPSHQHSSTRRLDDINLDKRRNVRSALKEPLPVMPSQCTAVGRLPYGVGYKFSLLVVKMEMASHAMVKPIQADWFDNFREIVTRCTLYPWHPFADSKGNLAAVERSVWHKTWCVVRNFSGSRWQILWNGDK